jgi:hypothetical protein
VLLLLPSLGLNISPAVGDSDLKEILRFFLPLKEILDLIDKFVFFDNFDYRDSIEPLMLPIGFEPILRSDFALLSP